MSGKKNRTLLVVGMIVLFFPMAFLGWMALGGRTTKAGVDQFDIQEPWSYLVWSAFIFIFVGFYYLMKKYKEQN